MTVRVNPNIVPEILSGLNGLKQQLNDSGLGARFRPNSSIQPSDNPGRNRRARVQPRGAKFFRHVSAEYQEPSIKIQIADSALNSAESVIQQAISLGVEAGSRASQRATARPSPSNCRESSSSSLVSRTPPPAARTFSPEPKSKRSLSRRFRVRPSAVDYNGNQLVTQVEIANGQ